MPTDGGKTVGQRDILQCRTPLKRLGINYYERVREIDIRQCRAAEESSVVNVLHTVGEGDACQRGMITESGVADTENTITDSYRCNGISINGPRCRRIGVPAHPAAAGDLQFGRRICPIYTGTACSGTPASGADTVLIVVAKFGGGGRCGILAAGAGPALGSTHCA